MSDGSAEGQRLGKLDGKSVPFLLVFFDDFFVDGADGADFLADGAEGPFFVDVPFFVDGADGPFLLELPPVLELPHVVGSSDGGSCRFDNNVGACVGRLRWPLPPLLRVLFLGRPVFFPVFFAVDFFLAAFLLCSILLWS